MSFVFSSTVNDILSAIKERQQEGANLDEYSLFLPKDDKYGMGLWMIPSRTIESYGLVTDDKIWFRKRTQLVQVLLPDGSTKKMMLEVSLSVKQLIGVMAEKLSINHPEAFGLQIAGKNKFLRMKSSLYEVAEPDDVITIKKRYFVQEGELNREDPMFLHLTYIQARDNIISGLYPCTKDEIIKFGSLNAMIDIGKYDESKKQTSIKQNLQNFVPTIYQNKDIEKSIFNEWKTMKAMTPIDAKYKYLQLCMTLRYYGMNIYSGGIEPKGSVHQTDAKKRKLIPVLMAFSPTEIKMLSSDFKVMVCEPYEHLKTWKFSSESVFFDFAKYNNGEVIDFYTEDGEDIYSLVAGYIDIISMKATKVVEDDKDVEKATEIQLTKQKKTAALKTTTLKTRVVAPTPIIATETIVPTNTTADVFQGNKSYALPVNFAVDIKEKTQSNEDLWRNQLRTQSDNLLGLLKPISESFKGNQKVTSEKIKQFGFYVDGIRESVLSGANYYEDKEVLEAMANNLMDSVKDFMDYCSLTENDPNNQQFCALMEEGKSRVEMCTLALSSATNGLVMDLDQDVIYELSNSVSANIDKICEVARNISGDKYDSIIREAQTNARYIQVSSQTMGLTMNSDDCRKKLKNLLEACKHSVVDLSSKIELKGTNYENDIDKISKECSMIESFIEDIKSDTISERKKFLDTTGNALQIVDLLSSVKNVRIEDVQKAAIELKKDIPFIIKYYKEYTSKPDVDDAKRAQILSNIKDLVSNAKLIISNADQSVFTQENSELLKEASINASEAIRYVLSDDINDVVHHSLYSDRKKVAISSFKLMERLDKVSKSSKITDADKNKIKEFSNTMMNVTEKLLKSVDINEKNEKKLMEESIELAKEYRNISLNINQVLNNLEEGKADLNEDKIQMDIIIDKLEQDVLTYEKEQLISSVQDSEIEFKKVCVKLKHELLSFETANELEETGIKEDIYEEAKKNIEEFSKARKKLEDIKPFDPSTPIIIEEFSKCSKKAIESIIKSSKTTNKKNERKLLLDAAMKQSNDASLLLKYAEEKSVGENPVMNSVILDLANDEKQILNLLRIEDDIETNFTFTSPVTNEEIKKEKEASNTIKQITNQIELIHKDLQKDVIEKKNAAQNANDPKLLVGAALQEAILVMINSSIGVLSSAYQSQVDLVSQLENPDTSINVHRQEQYADELIKAVEEVKNTCMELQFKIKNETVSYDELVTVADKVSKKVEKVVFSCRAGTKTKNNIRHKELLDASRKLAEATNNLRNCAKAVDEFDDTPVVVNINVFKKPKVIPAPAVIIEQKEQDIETFGIDEYTLEEIEHQKKIFELEKKLEDAKKLKKGLDSISVNFK